MWHVNHRAMWAQATSSLRSLWRPRPRTLRHVPVTLKPRLLYSNAPTSTRLKPVSVLNRSCSTQAAKNRVIPETKWYETPFSARVFDIFKLLNFSKSELSKVFEKLDTNQNGFIEREELDAYVRELCEKDEVELSMSNEERAQFCDMFMRKFGCQDGLISRENFDKVIVEMATKVDPRVWPITCSMVVTGIAVGVFLPVMPLFVKQMGLSASEFGIVVSAFGLSKLLGNIPCAFLADKYGRIPVMTAGMGLLSVGMGGIGLISESLSGLVLCRLVAGLGASAFTSASMLYLMDIGTVFNRTKTMAPISAGFSLGAAIGPALGGFMAHYFELQTTFLLTGSMFLVLMLLNRVFLGETLKPHLKLKGKLGTELVATVKQWRPLLSDSKFRSVLAIQSVYWLCLSGSYMTLLPLMLVREELGLNPAEIGGVYAMTSAVQVIATPGVAALTDKFGKPPAIVLASGIVASAMFTFPLMTNLTPSLAVLALWSLGGTGFGLAPTAYVTDFVKPEHRSQALALLRTTGDVGLLLGATTTGVIADYTTQTTAMQTNAGVLLLTGAGFGWATLLNRKRKAG